MRSRRMRVGAAVIAAVIGLVIVGVVVTDRDERAVPTSTSSSSSSTTAGPTTASATSATTTTALTTTTAASSTTAAPVTTTATTARPTTTPTTVAAPTTTAAPPTTPPPIQGGDRSVFVIGDSVLLGAQTTVPAALTGWDVTMDTVGSRRLPQAIDVLRQRLQEIGAVVVIQMGNNYIEGEDGTFASQIDEAMTVLTGVSRVVWLTVAERWPCRVVVNEAIRATPARWPNAVVADWGALVAAHPEYASDQLHLTTAGRLAIAELIATAVGPAPA